MTVSRPRTACTQACRPGASRCSGALAGASTEAYERHVLVDRDGAVATVARADELKRPRFSVVAKGALLVARCGTGRPGQDPDLQQVRRAPTREALCSLWVMPVPALMRCTSPGRMVEPLPMLSLCASAPWTARR